MWQIFQKKLTSIKEVYKYLIKVSDFNDYVNIYRVLS
jgi:uncharacterized short protein YbdD (DUF466 family)